jgi:predicted oxidoreductase
MKYIDLGGSGLMASAIGFGCMRLQGIEPAEVSGMVHAALEAGINFFDHAEVYGAGECEELFSRSVGMAPALREKMILQSKCGIRKIGRGFFDFSKDYILEAVDGILGRLRTDYLDTLLLHRPDTLMEPEEVAEALARLHAAGKVRHFGVSNENPMQMELLSKYLRQPIRIDQIQFGVAHTGIVDAGLNANMKNPPSVDHDGGILEYCLLKGITIQAWGPLSYGYFEGTFLDNPKFAELNETLGRYAKERGCSKAAVAISWILRHPAKIQPMIGFTDAGQIADLKNVAEMEFTRQEWYEIYLSAGNQLP